MLRDTYRSKAPCPVRAELVIDETTAHVAVAPTLAPELLAWFRQHHIVCSLRPQWAVGGQDLIDFGDPDAAEVDRIRDLFARWRLRHSPTQ